MISNKYWYYYMKPFFLLQQIKTHLIQNPESRIHQLLVMFQFNSIISIINNILCCAACNAYINKYFIRRLPTFPLIFQ